MMIGYIFALFSAFAMSISSVAAKQALKKEHSLDFSIFAHILGLLFLAPFIGFVSFDVGAGYLTLIYIASFLGTFGFWFTMKGLRYIDMSVETPLLNLSIIFTAILGYIFLGEKLGIFDIVGILFIFAGAYLLEANHGGMDLLYPFREFKKSKYLHLLFLGIICYSFSAIVDRTVLKEIDVVTYLFFIYIFATVNYLALFFMFHRHEFALNAIFKDAKDSVGWVVIFSISKLISNFLFASALTTLYAGIAIAIKRLSTFITVLFAGGLFHEKYWKWRAFSSAIMLFGVALIVFI